MGTLTEFCSLFVSLFVTFFAISWLPRYIPVIFDHVTLARGEVNTFIVCEKFIYLLDILGSIYKILYLSESL